MFDSVLNTLLFMHYIFHIKKCYSILEIFRSFCGRFVAFCSILTYFLPLIAFHCNSIFSKILASFFVPGRSANHIFSLVEGYHPWNSLKQLKVFHYIFHFYQKLSSNKLSFFLVKAMKNQIFSTSILLEMFSLQTTVVDSSSGVFLWI